MAVKSGFFNSINSDRKYDAEDVNSFFEAVIADGVLSTYGDVFVVEPITGMEINIKSGKAWFLNSWIVNTTSKVLTLSTAHVSYSRIDIIALDFDKTDDIRTNNIIIVEGTAAVSPTPPALLDVVDHLQIPLAHILVGIGVTEIVSGNITNKVGLSVCPFASGLLEQFDIETLWGQWDSEFSVWLGASDTSFQDFMTASDNTFVAWMVENADLIEGWDAEFRAWMLSIEDDIAALENGDVFIELAKIRDRVPPGRNLIINGDMQVNQRTDKEVVTGQGATPPYYRGVADRWALSGISALGLWTLSRESLGNGKLAYKGVCTSARAELAYSVMFRFLQTIEACLLGELHKGTSDAKEMILSWDFKSSTTGTYIAEIYDRQNDRHVSTSINYNTADVWESFDWLVPKDLSGPLTLDNTAGFEVSFWLMAGTAYNFGSSLQTTWGPKDNEKRAYGQLNLAATLGNYFQITDIQLEIGDHKSEFERLPHDTVLAKCQRYMEFWERYYTYGIVSQTDELFILGDIYRTKKRAAPSVIEFETGWLMVYTEGVPPLTNPVAHVTENQEERPSFFVDAVGSTLTRDLVYYSYFDKMLIDAELYYV